MPIGVFVNDALNTVCWTASTIASLTPFENGELLANEVTLALLH
jgi:hypothetical protein